jgi:hypothetical protein
MGVMRSSLKWLVLIPLVLAACAPRVSKRGPQVAVEPTPVAPQAAPVVAAAEPAPSAEVAAAPVAAEAPPPAWKPAPQAVASAESTEAEEDDAAAGAPEAAPAKATKRTYYAYSDAEIAALRKQSAEFRKLDQQLKVCAAKSAEAIERREEIPTEIAKIRMSKGGLTPEKERKIDKLKAEQARLKSADRGQCSALEDRLTAMLQSTYDTSETAMY